MNKYIKDGRELRDEGAAVVTANTDPDWVAACDGVISTMAVRDFCGDPPHHHNAMGARFLSAAKQGIIVRVGFANSRRKRSHAAMIAVYRGSSYVS